MSYGHLLAELKRLTPLALQDDVHHIGRRPMTPATLKKKGFTASAAVPSLVARIGGKPSRRIADRMADEPFRWGKNCFPGRYSKGFPALYAAQDLPTAIAEIKHHLLRRGAVAHGLKPEYLIMAGHVSGRGKNLQAFPNTCLPELKLDTDYRPTQALGAAARAEPLAALRAPSPRRSIGVNLPIFERAAIAPRDADRAITFFLDKSGKFAWTIAKRKK